MAMGEEVVTSDLSESSEDESHSSKSDSPLVKKPRQLPEPLPSSTMTFREPEVNHKQLPKSSGIMDFIEWAVAFVLADDDRKTLASKFLKPVAIGSMCSGMATEDFAMHAITNALKVSGRSTFSYVSSFKAESDRNKAAFLRRHVHKDVSIISCNADVATHTSNPTCKVLTCGIVCVNISSLSSDKKHVSDQSGKSGESLTGMLESLRNWEFEQRPSLIILECTKPLGHRRKVDHDVPGTDFILAELGKLGYVGTWRLVCASMFYLPQSRPRAYGMFLKVTHLSVAASEARLRDLDKACSIISRARISTPEGLSVILERLPITQSVAHKPRMGKSKSEAKLAGDKWPGQHDATRRMLKLPEPLSIPPEHFLEQAHKLMVPRAADAMWLKLARAKLQRGFRWETDCCIVPVNMSIRFGNIGFDKFPCLTPDSKYVMVKDGQLSVMSSLAFLALQGIQSRELTFSRLSSEADRLLRDLAGNAFTANVVAIFLLAGLIVM